MTTVIESLQTYFKTYGSLVSNAPVLIDALGKEPTEYSINPLPGTRIVEQYLDTSTLREYPFAFNSMSSTADDLERLQNSGFYEALAEWLDTQTNTNVLPTLGTKQTAIRIEALGWGYLFEAGDSGTGIYQIQCKLTYEQAA